jgi:hypothetical protein
VLIHSDDGSVDPLVRVVKTMVTVGEPAPAATWFRDFQCV